MGDVTRILSDIESGDSGAAEQLLPLIYAELRRLAAAKMTGESPDHTLQPTALVHDAYLRLVDVERAQQWDSRGHFFAAAAEAMRRILVEDARRKDAEKHGGAFRRIPFDSSIANPQSPKDQFPDILSIDEALAKLEQADELSARLVKLRFFGGLTIHETAEVLDVSPRKANFLWAFARTWLFRELGNGPSAC